VLENCIFIEGFGFGNYKSYKDIQYIGPCSKINIIIGQNNSGKSNIIHFLTSHYSQCLNSVKNKKRFEVQSPFSGSEADDEADAVFSLGINKKYKTYADILEKFKHLTMRNLGNPGAYILDREVFLKTKGSELKWIGFNKKGSCQDTFIRELESQVGIGSSAWQGIWSRMTNKTGGDLILHWVPEVVHSFYSEIVAPEIILIPCFRKIELGGSSGKDHDVLLNGESLILKLAELQNPSYNMPEMYERFEKINLFLKNLTGDQSAKIEIPFQRDTINVYMNGRNLPIQNLGTGIHQVLILAAAATALSKKVVCIEEPELYLHPDLQRKLMCYLSENTDNQYFITTHSAHILDTPNSEIFHVNLCAGQSKVKRVSEGLDKFQICRDLGYKASDLIQANSIIWVEGPSDRIYVNAWLKALASDLIEGLHYSIMFYGGRLLSHLTASDSEELSEFISLSSLNQNMAILIDSDKKNSKDSINLTKQRIEEEFVNRNCFVWITQGREIENYIEFKKLKEAIIHVQGEVEVPTSGQFKSLLDIKKDGKKVNPKKFEIAKKVVEDEPDFSILDLKQKANELVAFVRDRNGKDVF
jgi:predicted ATP-dependent endonuclease of OLD family